MQYVHILNLIDTYLDRLREARQVLLALDDSPSRARRLAGPPPIRMKKLKTLGSVKQGVLGLDIAPPKRKRADEPAKGRVAAIKRVAVRSANAPRLSEPAFVQDELFPQEPAQEPAPQPAPHAAQETNEKPLVQVVCLPVATKIAAPRRSRTRNKTASPPAARALGGTVSAAPVFISASQIRQERSQKSAELKAQADGFGASTPAPLTAELLTQRWVQGLNP